jgi:hypothetical protein
MNLREAIDKVFLEHADKTGAILGAIMNAISRFDVDSSVDRLLFINGIGHLIGLPTRPGTSSTATTGVPTNAVQGFAPSALFFNFKSTTLGTFLYCNTGTFLSSTWTNIV